MRKGFLLLIVVLFAAASILAGGCKDGQQPSGGSGTVVTPTQKDFVPESRVKLYRIPADGSQYLVPELRSIKVTKDKLPEQTVRELVNYQPLPGKTLNLFPVGTKVLSVVVKNGIAYVNFSRELLTKQEGDYGQLMLLTSIVNSLTEEKSIHKVQFLVEGKKAELLGQQDIEEPWVRNTDFFKK